ncbi:hypothetical protein [Methylobacterium sp.]|uniref:hypothetical protein n=1 Tax=Methylobacterium sp. TaxID=409 RepID=UPI00257E9DBD|nr:hypothetical protein [Methylobacterium sp.]
MPVDPIDDILGYLGLGDARPEERSSPDLLASRPQTPVTDEAGTEHCLATRGPTSVWVAGNADADWLEVRGPFQTLRATRPKARLLVTLKSEVERWSAGGTPDVSTGDLIISTVHRFGTPYLEVRHRTWKPIRLSREQARAVLRFFDQVTDFAAV